MNKQWKNVENITKIKINGVGNNNNNVTDLTILQI
jgi:hypothetical protein